MKYAATSAGITLGLTIGNVLWGIRDPKELAFKAIIIFTIVLIFLSLFARWKESRMTAQ